MIKQPRARLAFLAASLFAAPLHAAGDGVLASGAAATNIVASIKNLKTPSLDMGELAKPGATLGGKNFTVGPGESLTFSARQNQINGVGLPTINGEDAARSPLKFTDAETGAVDGQDGRTLKHAYAFAVSAGTPAGVYTIRFPGTYQARNDPDYAFSFKITVK